MPSGLEGADAEMAHFADPTSRQEDIIDTTGRPVLGAIAPVESRQSASPMSVRFSKSFARYGKRHQLLLDQAGGNHERVHGLARPASIPSLVDLRAHDSTLRFADGDLIGMRLIKQTLGFSPSASKLTDTDIIQVRMERKHAHSARQQ